MTSRVPAVPVKVQCRAANRKGAPVGLMKSSSKSGLRKGMLFPVRGGVVVTGRGVVAAAALELLLVLLPTTAVVLAVVDTGDGDTLGLVLDTAVVKEEVADAAMVVSRLVEGLGVVGMANGKVVKAVQ